MEGGFALCVNCAWGFAGGTKIKQLKKYLVVVLGIAMLMVVAMCASTLYQSYRQTRLSAVANAGNVTLISQRAISRNLEVLSLSLDTLAYRYQHPISGRGWMMPSAMPICSAARPASATFPSWPCIGPKGVLASSRRRAGDPRPTTTVPISRRTAIQPTSAVRVAAIQANLGNELRWWCCPSACSMTMAALAASS
jgi:hypothetical protein